MQLEGRAGALVSVLIRRHHANSDLEWHLPAKLPHLASYMCAGSTQRPSMESD
jgi:hypothetical protein